jgi:hypothetical protein
MPVTKADCAPPTQLCSLSSFDPATIRNPLVIDVIGRPGIYLGAYHCGKREYDRSPYAILEQTGGAENGCSRYRIRDNSRAGRQTLFDKFTRFWSYVANVERARYSTSAKLIVRGNRR